MRVGKFILNKNSINHDESVISYTFIHKSWKHHFKEKQNIFNLFSLYKSQIYQSHSRFPQYLQCQPQGLLCTLFCNLYKEKKYSWMALDRYNGQYICIIILSVLVLLDSIIEILIFLNHLSHFYLIIFNILIMIYKHYQTPND